MSNMDRYAGVQNPQLYQQILEEERKRRAREAQNRTSISNFYSAMQSIGGGQSEAPASPASWQMTPEQRQAAYDLMGKTSSTNLYSSLYSKVLAGNAGSGAKAPEPTKKQGENDADGNAQKK